MVPDTGTPKRSTYRHGDLRNALIQAGVELARQGGPEAVVLRATTRHAGVAPNAAYRHFADRGALLHAVSQAAMAQVARTMEAEQAAVAPTADEKTAARARFRAVGTGYLRFAQEEPGLFRAAFHVPGDMTHAADDDAAGSNGKTPSNCSAPPSTASWRRACCPKTGAPVPSSSPGRPSTASPCSSSTAPSAASTPPRPTTRASTSST